jgi:hypothetical protein
MVLKKKDLIILLNDLSMSFGEIASYFPGSKKLGIGKHYVTHHVLFHHLYDHRSDCEALQSNFTSSFCHWFEPQTMCWYG